MKVKISAVILTKNEEANIERCLKSVDFCDEIIVIDDNSNDNTLDKIRNKSRIQIFKRKLDGDFAAQRNFGTSKAGNDWVLFIDADEEMTKELKVEISRIFLNPFVRAQDYSSIHDLDFRFPTSSFKLRGTSRGNDTNPVPAFYLKRRDYFWDKELNWGETRKVKENGLIRLVKKDSGSWEGKVHEEFKLKTPALPTGKLISNVKTLKNYLDHYPHQTLKEFLEEINFYSSLRAKELNSHGKKTNIFEIVFYPLGKFLLNYFLKLGFLDGAAGFTYAFLMSFHSFLVRVKLYQINLTANKRR